MTTRGKAQGGLAAILWLDNLATTTKDRRAASRTSGHLKLSQSEKHWRTIAPQLERQGLPKIDPVMKGRFWPAVEAFFRNRHGLGNMVGSQPDGEEMWDVP
jgi:hypothetical protein